ncbi:hypothetical protein [Paracoccus amoyensis]|nr:hypothetical protein [Paracoccus amoyensis]
MIRHLVFVVALIASPLGSGSLALAQEWTPPQADSQGEGESNWMDGIMGGVLNNLLNDVAPEMGQVEDGMAGIAGKLGPVLADLATQIDDLRNYQMPERLENGDIILRRKADAPPPPPLGDNLDGYSTPKNDPASPADPTKPEIEL